MHKYPNGSIEFEVTDLIRMNQLVRGRIDLSGFLDWYRVLPADEQSTLIFHLHLFAQQAGGKETTFQEAVVAAGVSEEDALIRTLASFRTYFSRELGMTVKIWLAGRDEEERLTLLPLLIYYFGLSEGEVFAKETVDSCNHWWHRDLLDPRVVHDLLNDPEYFRTSMKDDAAIKKNGKAPL